LFVGSIHAGIDGGQFDGNTAGTAMMAVQRATLDLHGTLVNAHVGARAMGLLADGNAVVTINNSTFSNMVAAALLVQQHVSLVVEGSTFRNNSCNGLDPHAPNILRAQGTSKATIIDSVFSGNTVPDGSVVFLADSAQVGGNNNNCIHSNSWASGACSTTNDYVVACISWVTPQQQQSTLNIFMCARLCCWRQLTSKNKRIRM
jgi:hypothetical protein